MKDIDEKVVNQPLVVTVADGESCWYQLLSLLLVLYNEFLGLKLVDGEQRHPVKFIFGAAGRSLVRKEEKYKPRAEYPFQGGQISYCQKLPETFRGLLFQEVSWGCL